MERCSASVHQITMSCPCLVSARMSISNYKQKTTLVGRDGEELGSSCTVGRDEEGDGGRKM